MASKRVFIAINFNEGFKKELLSIQREIDTSFSDTNPIKWTKKDNLHLTLLFVGFTNNLENIFNKIQKITKKYKPFSINFNEVNYSLNNKMVWVLGEKNKTLTSLSNDLGNKNFIPHITLGRISTFNFNKINPEEIPQINNEILIDLKIKVNSIDIMHSNFKNYTLLKNFKL